MAKNFSNVKNSEENIIQFSDSDSELENGNQSNHTAAKDVRAETAHQQSAAIEPARSGRQISAHADNRQTSGRRQTEKVFLQSTSEEHKFSNHGPYHSPEFQTYETRVASFENWSKKMEQTKENMAEAGLFYTGQDDIVRCFHCGGTLCDWDANDDVWTEHARLFPLCPHVIIHKGNDFIEQATANEDDLTENSFQTLLKKQPELVSHLEDIRAQLLQMGYTDIQFHNARRHLKSMHIYPTLYDMISALCQLEQKQNNGFKRD